ncbi:hypothetical protein K503DRAFT_453834 [Rhizopogon vinicolor AM-OR11-026]|uniref:WW domain-containing protein n=1 Tax=Rhizopogon vinicolor AM-OR11-026 TaxID=1314800 RepID=A0A1B7MP27_9AGAM|nr:hypothetical protein K503DRAFT_453834 [Rhizopogon vinicolor AM-OR11-026]
MVFSLISTCHSHTLDKYLLHPRSSSKTPVLRQFRQRRKLSCLGFRTSCCSIHHSEELMAKHIYTMDTLLGCEWHISPLCPSYFVHNTRTTSWKIQPPERPTELDARVHRGGSRVHTEPCLLGS